MDKLDALESKANDTLVALARVEEQIKDVPDLKVKVAALERRYYTALGALAMSGGSIAVQIYQTLKGT